jgi:hypothetical protein
MKNPHQTIQSDAGFDFVAFCLVSCANGTNFGLPKNNDCDLFKIAIS